MGRAGVLSPKIAVAGLNPHCGEGGLFGHEEIEEIIPAIKKAEEMGINVIGPVSPDTLFARGKKGEFDAIITLGAVIEGATDHDQIVAQHASRKIADLALEYDTPVALGITGPGMTRIDAHRRVKNAKSAVEAAIKMCDRLKEI